MTDRSSRDLGADFKRLLSDRADQGWIFGVCATLARRAEWELWGVRTAAAIALLLKPFWAGVAYFALAMIFYETRPGAQEKLVRWARRADDALEVLVAGLRRIIAHRRGHSDDAERDRSGAACGRS